MNLQHVLDVYFSTSGKYIICLRRRDSFAVLLKNIVDPKEIGQAVIEGLEPSKDNKLHWEAEEISINWSEIDNIVVVWRDSGQTIVGTPYHEWGKAPKILLNHHPSFIDIGNAVLQQVAYCSEKEKSFAEHANQPDAE